MNDLHLENSKKPQRILAQSVLVEVFLLELQLEEGPLSRLLQIFTSGLPLSD